LPHTNRHGKKPTHPLNVTSCTDLYKHSLDFFSKVHTCPPKRL